MHNFEVSFWEKIPNWSKKDWILGLKFRRKIWNRSKKIEFCSVSIFFDRFQIFRPNFKPKIQSFFDQFKKNSNACRFVNSYALKCYEGLSLKQRFKGSNAVRQFSLKNGVIFIFLKFSFFFQNFPFLKNHYQPINSGSKESKTKEQMNSMWLSMKPIKLRIQ